MQPSKRLLVLGLFMLLSACGIEPDERVYGTWVEPLTGETIEFREDGTLGWFGHEGTFAFKKSTSWATGSDTGQVAVDVDGQSFRISYYSDHFDEDPNSWSMGFRSFSSFPYEATINSKTTGGFLVNREGTTSGAYNPPGFERIDNGLTRFHPHAEQIRTYDGVIVGFIDGKLWRLNSQTATWEVVREDLDSDLLKLDPEVIHNSDEYSLDGGTTWKPLPEIGDSDGSSILVSMGTSLFATVYVYVYSEGEARDGQIWTIDLADRTPTWILQTESTLNEYGIYDLTPIPAANTLVRSWWEGDDDGMQLELSTDSGITFVALESPCSWSFYAHANGIYCKGEDGSLQWYDLTTQAWSTITTESGDMWVESNRPRDELYLVRDSTFMKIATDGSETILTSLGDDSGGYPRIFFLEDSIIMSHLTLWMKSL